MSPPKRPEKLDRLPFNIIVYTSTYLVSEWENRRSNRKIASLGKRNVLVCCPCTAYSKVQSLGSDFGITTRSA